MEEIQISVIVPVYNSENFICTCIESLINQSLHDIEIICIDDGSYDRSGVICDKYAQQDNRIKVFHRRNEGVSGARNFGIRVAKGTYIAFIDSDDCVHPNFLETLYKVCCDSDCDIAQCNVKKFTNIENIINCNRCSFAITTGKEMVHKRFEKDGWKNIVPCNKLYKKSLFNEIKFPVGKRHEDEFIIYKIFWSCECVAYSDAELYYYRQQKNSFMHKRNFEDRLHAIDAFEERAQFFSDKDIFLYGEFTIQVQHL